MAEMAFDNFLQENDRLSMEAQRKAELEAKKTTDKEGDIKMIESEIMKIKSDIYDLKDVYTKYSNYGQFLTAIAPEEWRHQQVLYQPKIFLYIRLNLWCSGNERVHFRVC